MIPLRQSSAVSIPTGQILDISNAYTPYTSAIAYTSVLLDKGGAVAAKNSTTGISPDSNGLGYIVLNATDTATLGSLLVIVPATSSYFGLELRCWVYTAQEYDARFAGTDVQQVHVIEMDQEIESDIADTMIRRPLADARAGTNRGTKGANIFQSALGAFARLVNKTNTTTNVGFLTTFEENGTTEFGRQAVTSDATANPVTGLGTGVDQ